MKYSNILLLIIVGLSLSACWPLCPSGCWVYLGEIKSDQELPKWEKAEITPLQRRLDSRECGSTFSIDDKRYGDDVNFYKNGAPIGQKPGESIYEADDRNYFNWQRCMLGKGYQYIGKCYDNDISRRQPKCEAFFKAQATQGK